MSMRYVKYKLDNILIIDETELMWQLSHVIDEMFGCVMCNVEPLFDVVLSLTNFCVSHNKHVTWRRRGLDAYQQSPTQSSDDPEL